MTDNDNNTRHNDALFQNTIQKMQNAFVLSSPTSPNCLITARVITKIQPKRFIRQIQKNQCDNCIKLHESFQESFHRKQTTCVLFKFQRIRSPDNESEAERKREKNN